MLALATKFCLPVLLAIANITFINHTVVTRKRSAGPAPGQQTRGLRYGKLDHLTSMRS
nr:MAG TPA: hypothetical protein [Bacteriophage sp.]